MNNPLADSLKNVANILSNGQVQWCLVGGLAISARAEPRFTRDVDLAIATQNDDEAESIVRMLRSAGWQTLAVLEHQAIGRLATVRFLPPGTTGARIIVDMLFSSSGIELETVTASTLEEIFPGQIVPVAAIPHLLAMKVLASNERDRPQDVGDIQSLLAVSTEEQVKQTLALLTVIEHRGTNRGKHLADEFNQFRQRFRPVE